MIYDELLSLKTIPKELSNSPLEANEQGMQHTAYRDEIRLLSCVKAGDVAKLFEEAKNFQQGIFVGQMANSSIMQYKYMAVSCITLATRYAIQGGLNENEAYNFSDEFIRLIDSQNEPDKIIGFIFEKIIELTNLVKEARKKPKHSPYIKKCLLIIEKKLNEKITVTMLAEECGITADYLSQLFKKEMGEKISSYILRHKLELAQTLIFDGFDNSKICYMLGFSSQSHYISAFKKQFGVTPNEYLKTMR